MFVGRTRELNKLEELYRSNQFEMVVIYGRRRIGKTTLINQFLKNHDAIYFTGIEANAKVNLENFSDSIMRGYVEGGGTTFSSFQQALEQVFHLAQEQRTVLVIDEYPYLAKAYKPFSSMLQKIIDEHKDSSKLFIILCGSSVSFMENNVLGYKSPLFGRKTAQMKIEPFDFAETRSFFPTCPLEDCAVLYGITGGIPLYISKMDAGLSMEENIKRNFFDPSAYLFDEPTNLVKQECRDAAQYNSVIQAIASGASRLSEISSKVGLESALCSSYLKTLITIGIVKKEHPMLNESTKKTIYRLSDSMFQFWYRFVPDHISLINKGAADRVYQLIASQLPAFMGFVFEEICKQYLWKQNLDGACPVPFIDLGRWWGSDPIKKQESEIDILAVSERAQAMLLAECKWTKALVGADVLSDLTDQARLFPKSEKHFYLFAKSGFTPECIQMAKQMDNCTLLTFSEMF